jgi:hypothetical protein
MAPTAAYDEIADWYEEEFLGARATGARTSDGNPLDTGDLLGDGERPGLRAGQLTDNAPYRLRAAQGVVGMGDRPDRSRLKAACARAITAEDPSYRTIKASWPSAPTAAS